MTQAPVIDWDEVLAELSATLREYLRIDTSNPPGNEEAAARFLGGILEREGFAPEYIEAGPGRVSLRAVLTGRGEAAPLMLLNHTDVVPAQAEFWEVDPFAGVERDGCIWGRGALDMKGMGILELLVLLLFKRHGITPNRDIIYLAVADEETGSAMGMEWLDSNRPELLREPEFAINEGGLGLLNFLGARRPVFACSPAEKGPLWIRLRASGEPGHGSIPHEANAVDRLARALNAIQQWEHAFTVQPLTQAVVDGLQRAHAWGEAAPSVAGLCEQYPGFRAMLSNTISATSLQGGVRHQQGGVAHNVIPAYAEATLDCRLLPGESHDAFLHALREVIDDGHVQVEVVFQSESAVSDFSSALVSVMQEVVGEQVEGALVLPVTSVGFTDSRVLRRHGVRAYGFIPTLMDASLAAGIHGHNERMPVEGLRTGVQILFEVVRRFTA